MKFPIYWLELFIRQSLKLPCLLSYPLAGKGHAYFALLGHNTIRLRNMIQKALVTGGTGFIGSHLVETLLKRGSEVRCLVRNKLDLKWLHGLPVELIEGHCHNINSLREAVKGVDQVFHSAGVTKAIDEKTYFEVNAIGTKNLIQACIETNPNLKKFIYLSSQAAAGPCQSNGRKRESDECLPVSPYGRSKRKGEEFCLELSSQIPMIIIRPSAVYGPRDRDVFAFFKILSKGIKPQFSKREQRISLCYVLDVIEAILLASESKSSEGEIFFISDGQDYRLDRMGDLFTEALNLHAHQIYVPGWIISWVASASELLSRFTKRPPLINRGKVEEMMQENWLCDITKAKTLLGYEPQFPLAVGLKITYEWYLKERWL